MNELELLLLRLEDMTESAENKDARLLAKALSRYFKSTEKQTIGFNDSKRKKKDE